METSDLKSLIRGKGGSTEESSSLSERFSLSFDYLSQVKPHSSRSSYIHSFDVAEGIPSGESTLLTL